MPRPSTPASSDTPRRRHDRAVEKPHRRRRPIARPEAHRPLPDPREPIELEPFESVIARITSVAGEHAADPAVVLGEQVWSYADLVSASLGLAAELEALGVEPGDAVAVTGTKCHGLVVAILAVLARNAVLVPIDPVLPALRRREMLERAGARILIEAGDPGFVETMQVDGLDVRQFSIPAVPVVDDAARSAAAAYQLPAIDGDDPAYLLFTSGTTGEPKGIVGRQRGLSHFLGWERTVTGIGPGDRTAQLTGLSFDVVLRDLFLPLTSGAALHLPPFVPGTTPPSDLFSFLARDRITLIHAVPTIATFWLTDVPAGLRLPDLRWVLFAGEPLPGSLVSQWRRALGRARIGNLYGPTETTLAKCFREIGPTPESGIQPVGHAIPGAQALVMDGDRLCEPEELGEIVIRTPYRSHGYLGATGDPRPPFERNPFTDDPDDQIYRTGDRGRYRPDGTLEIHGRLDDQVKILGVRIEPAEIAGELSAHPSVTACAVVARPDERGETALVAYVVPSDGRLDEGGLRGYLAERLIAAKVPRVFVPLTELPRTPNGKVDRRALPEPQWSGHAPVRPDDDATSTGRPIASGAGATGRTGPGPDDPATDVPAATLDTIVSIFREMLATPQIGPDDDYFRLGGHSLMAARLVQRIQERTGVPIRVRALFQNPTPRGLAGMVAVSERRDAESRTDGAEPRGRGSDAVPDSIVPIRTTGRRPPVFVVPGVGSRILYLRHLGRYLGEDQPVYALHAMTLEDGSTYERIEDLARMYVRAIRTIEPHGPYRLVGFSFGGLVALEVGQQLRALGEEIELLGIVDTRLPSLRQHGSWSVARSIPRRLLNLAALLQPLSGPERRAYLRNRLLIARQSTEANVIQWLARVLPRPLRGRLRHPYGPEEMAWLAADGAAWARYDPRRYPGRITYFWAMHSQRPPEVYDHREGWAELAEDGLDIRPIPGSHFTVLIEPLVRSTSAAIREALEAVSATSPTPSDRVLEGTPGDAPPRSGSIGAP